MKLGPDHPDTLNTMCNLATAYKDAGQFDEAEPLLRKAVAGASRTFGPDHSFVQSCLADLAYLNWRKVDSGSGSLFEKLLGLHRKDKGVEDAETIRMAINLAVNYREDRRLLDAEKVIEEWLPRARAKLGLGDAITRWGVDEAIILYNLKRQPAKAEPLYRELAGYWKEKAGAKSPQYAQQLGSIGPNLLSQAKIAAAEPILRECLTIREEIEPDAWTTFHTRLMLGVCALRPERLRQGRTTAPGGLPGHEAARGEDPARCQEPFD